MLWALVQSYTAVADFPVVLMALPLPVEIPQVADVPARAVHRQCGRPYNHAATRCLFNSRGASDSLHRQSRGHSCCTTETGTMLPA